MARLGDYVRIRTGKLDANASSDNGQYPFFTCAVEPLKIDTYSYDCECVLVAGNGDLNVKYYNGKFDAYQRTYIIESLDKTVLSVPYLYCFLDKYVETLRQQAIGGVIKYIKLGNLTEADIPIPSISEQEKIVEKLGKAKKLIVLRKEQFTKLDELVKSRFIELFGSIHENKFGYEIKTLQDVCEPIKDGTHQTPTYTDDVVNGYKFLSSKDVTTGKIDWTHLKYIPEELHNELYARIAPRKGDVLLAKNGTTGIAAIVDREEIFDIYVSLALLRPIEINSIYLWAAINSVETKQQFDSSLKGIGVPNLHLGEIKKAKIIVPPMDEQNQFTAFVGQTDKSKLAIQQSLDKLGLLKKSLMQEYFG